MASQLANELVVSSIIAVADQGFLRRGRVTPERKGMNLFFWRYFPRKPYQIEKKNWTKRVERCVPSWTVGSNDSLDYETQILTKLKPYHIAVII